MLMIELSPIVFVLSLYDKLVSTKVEPDLGSPIIKIGEIF